MNVFGDFGEFVVGEGGLLTDAERAAVQKAGELWGDLCAIVADDRTRDSDLRELVAHIHAIQHAIMSQAAARAYPDMFRLLGGTVGA